MGDFPSSFPPAHTDNARTAFLPLPSSKIFISPTSHVNFDIHIDTNNKRLTRYMELLGPKNLGSLLIVDFLTSFSTIFVSP